VNQPFVVTPDSVEKEVVVEGHPHPEPYLRRQQQIRFVQGLLDR
jgi:hypothetical protein